MRFELTYPKMPVFKTDAYTDSATGTNWYAFQDLNLGHSD